MLYTPTCYINSCTVALLATAVCRVNRLFLQGQQARLHREWVRGWYGPLKTLCCSTTRKVAVLAYISSRGCSCLTLMQSGCHVLTPPIKDTSSISTGLSGLLLRSRMCINIIILTLERLWLVLHQSEAILYNTIRRLLPFNNARVSEAKPWPTVCANKNNHLK